MSFHIATWTVDTATEFPDIITNDYAAADIAAMVDTLKTYYTAPGAKAGDKYLYAIDVMLGNDLKPLLKCDSPCFTCLDAVSTYCLSCWGQFAGEDSTGARQANTMYYL
jgi:hypothetical protein